MVNKQKLRSVSGMNESAIGRKINDLRTRQMMTLDKLSAYTGFSKGYLSKVENSKKAPPISTLTRISQALDVNFIELVNNIYNGDGKTEIKPLELCITKKDDVSKVRDDASSRGHIYKPLAYQMRDKIMRPYIVVPGFQKKVNMQHEHEGEEFIYVLEGKLEFFFNGTIHILEEGDSAYFNAKLPHFGRSLGNKKAKLLLLIDISRPKAG